MANYRTVAVVFVALTVIFAAATGYLLINPSAPATSSTSSASTLSVNIAYKSGIGFYLVNGTGWTLYFRTSDTQSNGTSGCYGNCISAWPAFYTSGLTVPASLNQSSFKPVTRTDGIKQLSYDGWPLYYYAGDKKPGDVNGQGLGKVWFACCSVVTTTTSGAAGGTSPAAFEFFIPTGTPATKAL